MMVSSQGKAIRFSAAELRSASRMSGGVRGMRLTSTDDEIVALEVVVPGAMLLTTSETGLGKRTDFSEYPPHSRGGQGVLTHNVTARTGKVVSARAVVSGHELMVMSESGIVMRTTVDSVSKVGRSAQGVHIMNIGQGDRVACVATIDLSKTPASPVPAAPEDAAPEGDATNGNGASNGRRGRGNGRSSNGRTRRR
jgi:DNA gyrase subunit A